MKIHEIINGLFELQQEHGIKFKEIRFENYHDISYLAITIKKGDKIMKHVYSSDFMGSTDNDYLDFAFDRMVEEIKGGEMTEKEKIIVSAYTGILMTDFSKVHEYIEKKLGRPVWTHEFADKAIWEEIKKKSEDDFLDICKKDDNSDCSGDWERIKRGENYYLKCSKCGKSVIDMTTYISMNFCPYCGTKMIHNR